jgi:7-cyano-7-deazaguanine reductase
MTIDNTNVSKVLGKIVDYPNQYDKSILVREPRQSNRVHLNISDDAPPFDGYDVWNAYEVSALTQLGLPVSGLLKIIYPATNKYIVESKSLKLYLNSFNMYAAGSNTNEVISFIENTVKKDLSDLLETNVQCRFYTTKEVVHYQKYDEYRDSYWNEYTTLEETFDLNTVVFNRYQEDPFLLVSDYKYLVGEPNSLQYQKYHSSLLKSNCRVTRQPDWGDVFIDIKTPYHINPISLAKYIVSFRDECHFHEEICETIFKRLLDTFQPESLIVKCLYTRRGGIDICPIRTTPDINSHLLDITCAHVPYYKTPRQ